MGLPASRVYNQIAESTVATGETISITVGSSLEDTQAYIAFVRVKPTSGANSGNWIDGISFFTVAYRTDGIIRATNNSESSYLTRLQVIKLYPSIA